MQPAQTELAYTYEPADFFEAPTSLRLRCGLATFDAGEAVLTLSQPQMVGHVEAAAMTEQVRAAFRARQLTTWRTYSLMGPRVAHLDTQGRRHDVMLVESGRFETRFSDVDFRIHDASGAVVHDSKSERLREEALLLSAIACIASASPELGRMLESYSRSLADQPNALVHLYEVRDAAVTHFQSEDLARTRLKISRADWSRLGLLANAEPVREGRHRGQHEQLRPATLEELHQARDIARRIIVAFAESL